MQCPKCGQPIRIGSRLCPNCGAWLGESDGRTEHDVPLVRESPYSTANTYVVPPPVDLGAWGPPNAAHRVEQPAPFGEPRSFSAAVREEFDEATTLSARRSKPQYWTLTLPNGIVELVTDRIVIGRHPEYMPSLPSARLIPVPDPTRSVSKNHACFSISGPNLLVEDLGSTNGIIVTRPDGHEHDIGVRGRAELEVGARVELGDVVLTVGKA
jgi:hypothetical protein